MNNFGLLKTPFGSNFDQSVLTILLEQTSYWVFFTLYKYFRLLFNQKIIIYDLANKLLSSVELQNSLAILFLGEYNIYWLDGSNLEIQEHTKWVLFLENYLGPHKIIFFSIKQKFGQISNSSNLSIVMLTLDLGKQDFINLNSIFYNLKADVKTEFFKQQNFGLEDVFKLMAYQSVLPKQIEERAVFRDIWLNKLIVPTKSLYILGQYFFAKQANHFFDYWNSIEDLYTQEYWVVFWSEQVWQALNFVENAKIDLVTAKLQSRKLPFSFVNTDWINYSKEYLTNAYNALYILDYNFKNLLSSQNLNFWFHQFLNNKF